MINLALDSRIKHQVLESALYSRLSDVRHALIDANRLSHDPANVVMRGYVQELEAERTCIRLMLGLSPFPLSPFVPQHFPDRRRDC